ncbi:hypothetical protein [Flaviaesturariibacter amylovorans]|uniref:Uncharacterized protein n=1 Tax=Flaviaesturariibacter amylovorans TaxID=1084520 RepID=A0ABP8GVF9_9BACT
MTRRDIMKKALPLMYTIPVRIESFEKRRRMIGTLHIISGFYLLVNAAGYVAARKGLGMEVALPMILMAFGALVYGWRRKKLDPTGRYNMPIRALEAVCFLFLALAQSGAASFGLYAWAVLSVLLLFSEKALFTPTALTFTDEGILVPGSPKADLLPWNILERVIVRPDFVTLMRNDNKYVQLEVLSALDATILDGANSFSAAQIQKSEKASV